MNTFRLFSFSQAASPATFTVEVDVYYVSYDNPRENIPPQCVEEYIMVTNNTLFETNLKKYLEEDQSYFLPGCSPYFTLDEAKVIDVAGSLNEVLFIFIFFLSLITESNL